MNHNEGQLMRHYWIELHKDWCTYGKFQIFSLHCSYVILACSSVRHDTFLHLSDVYKFLNLFGVFNNSFPIVASEEYWSTYQGDVIFHDENMRRKKNDRLNIRNEYDIQNGKKVCYMPSYRSYTETLSQY